MMWSANEVMNLAAKAARGGGAPAAQASDFGRAALCHLMAERAQDDLAEALDQLPAGIILDAPVAFARLIEAAQDDLLEAEITLLHNDTLMLSYAEALPYAGTVSAVGDRLVLRLSLSTPAAQKTPARVALSENLALKMHRLAARTFVPESDASRLAGAGAGLTDND